MENVAAGRDWLIIIVVGEKLSTLILKIFTNLTILWIVLPQVIFFIKIYVFSYLFSLTINKHDYVTYIMIFILFSRIPSGVWNSIHIFCDCGRISTGLFSTKVVPNPKPFNNFKLNVFLHRVVNVLEQCVAIN